MHVRSSTDMQGTLEYLKLTVRHFNGSDAYQIIRLLKRRLNRWLHSKLIILVNSNIFDVTFLIEICVKLIFHLGHLQHQETIICFVDHPNR